MLRSYDPAKILSRSCAPPAADKILSAGTLWGVETIAARFLMPEVQMAMRLGEIDGGPAIAIRIGRRIVVSDPKRRLPVQLVLQRLFGEGGDARHVLLPVSEPANAQVLMRLAHE